MATEINVTGQKKLGTLRKEFTEKFPYLRLGIFPLTEKNKDRKTQYDQDKTISEVRTKVNPGGISIHGATKVANLETEFEKVYGLYVQVCYTKEDGTGYFSSGKADDMTLTALNEHGKKNNWKEGVW